MSKSTTTTTAPKTSALARAVKVTRTEASKAARATWMGTVQSRKISEVVVSLLMAGESAKTAEKFTRSAFRKINADKATICRLVCKDISNDTAWDVLGEEVMADVLSVFLAKRAEILTKMRLAGIEGRKAHRDGIKAVNALVKVAEARKLPESAVKRLASAEAILADCTGNPGDIIK